MTDSRRRRVTSVDVAREAGLSRATVSYVLNDTPGQSIPEPTRQRVLAVARKLGYTPSAPARALRSGRSDLVLMLLPDWPQGTTMIDMVEAATDALADLGLTLLTHHSATSHFAPMARMCAAISPAAVAGVVPFTKEEDAELRRAGVEIIFPGADAGTPEALSWMGAPGRIQAHYLIEQGHTRLGYALPEHPRLHGIAQARLAQVAAVCAEHGLQPPTARRLPLEPSAAAAAVAAWRTEPGSPTAICAYNDDVAIALLAGARSLGLAVPDDVAVIGVDDGPMAKLAYPALTTVGIDAPAHGRTLAAHLAAQIKGLPVPGVEETAERLIVRESA
ncbi:LacI family DNA-binding transcriptional regulator [Nonomuraea angiospora]